MFDAVEEAGKLVRYSHSPVDQSHISFTIWNICIFHLLI